MSLQLLVMGIQLGYLVKCFLYNVELPCFHGHKIYLSKSFLGRFRRKNIYKKGIPVVAV